MTRSATTAETKSTLAGKETPMTVDEFDLRRVARDLEHAYRELNAAKHTRPQPKGERIMRARPGPQAPGNLLIISLDRDLVSRLHQYVRDAANHVDPTKIITWDGADLCRWIAWHASAIAELDFATDMLDEMVDQARKINRRLHPAGIQATANSDPYLTADSIQRTLTARGLECPEGTIRRWASEGDVATKTRRDGRRAYRLGDIIQRLTARP